MKKFLSALACMTAFATLAVSCGDDDTDDPQPAPVVAVESVKITPSPASVVAGETLELKAEITPENATPQSIEWGTRNASIASIDKQTGVVTGVEVGEVQVYVIVDGKTAVCALTVTAAPIRVETIELSKTEMALFVGKSETLTATISPENATYPTVTWKSSDEAIATVDESGKVVAVAEGTATITATADEKEATCTVTVSVPEIEVSAVSNMDAMQGNTVALTGIGFKAGDKVQLEALAGEAFSAEAAIAGVTGEGATFELPAGASKDRSYKLTFLREGAAKAVAYLRPDNDFVTIPYHLGYYMVGKDEVDGLEDDPSMRCQNGATDGSGVTYRGYIAGRIFEYDPDTQEFKVWKKDAALTPFNIAEGGDFDVQYTTGVTDLSPLFELYPSLPMVGSVWTANSSIEKLDMTRFPNATALRGWGDPGSQLNKLAEVNFGTYTDDEHALRLQHIQLERNSIKELDLRNCVFLDHFSCQDNQITKINLGTATGIAGQDKDQMIIVNDIDARNNQLREFDITNCGRLRCLKLEGNKIERINLQNNALGEGPMINGSPVKGRPDSYFPYTYILKDTEHFSITWATAEEAQGERLINAERYWWRVFSAANGSESPENIRFEGGWVENGPVVQALKAGFKVVCWTYWNEAGPDPHIVDSHEGGSDPCTY